MLQRPAVVHADVASANIVGYANNSVEIGWNVFTPTFRSIGTTLYLKDIIPALTNSNDLTIGGKITLQLMADRTAGEYSTTVYSWYPEVGGWSKDEGVSKIGDNECPLDSGVGFAICNNVRINKTTGQQGTHPTQTTPCPIFLKCSGEVDLVNQNLIPVGWAVSGNSTPVVLYLKDFEPTLTNGVALTVGGKITLQLMADRTAGEYSTTVYSWYPEVGGWSKDEGVSKIGDKECPLEPGVGFAICNNVRINKTTGQQGTHPTQTTPCPIFLNVTKELVGK